MFKVLALSLIVVGHITCLEVPPQYQYGYNVGVFATQSHDHILMSSREAGRTIDLPVKFQQAFASHPKIAIATSLLDVEAGSPSGFSADVIEVSHKGFTIRVTALSTKHINSIAFNWFATNDPQIFIEYIDTKDLKALSTGDRVHTLNVPMLGWDHETKPIAASYLVGVMFGHGDHPAISQKVSNIYDSSIDIKFSSHGDARVHGASVCLVFTTNPHAFTTGELGMRVDKNHPWMHRHHHQLTNVQVKFDIPEDITKGSRVFFSGLTGFEAPIKERNLRINIQDLKEEKDHVKLSYGTWSNSQLKEIGFNAFVFKVSDKIIHGENCAVVYSEKNLKGQSETVCSKSPVNLVNTNFEGKIKSFYIPPGGRLILFNIDGSQKHTYTETHDEWDIKKAFTFVQSSEEQVEFESTDGEGEYVYYDSEESGEAGEAGEAGVHFVQNHFAEETESQSEEVQDHQYGEEGQAFGEETAMQVHLAHAKAQFGEEGEVQAHSEEVNSYGSGEEGQIFGEETIVHVHLAQEGAQFSEEGEGESHSESHVAAGEEGQDFGEEAAMHMQMAHAGAQFAEEGEGESQSEAGEEGHQFGEESRLQVHLAQAGAHFGEEEEGQSEFSAGEEGQAFGEESVPYVQLAHASAQTGEEGESTSEETHFHHGEEGQAFGEEGAMHVQMAHATVEFGEEGDQPEEAHFSEQEESLGEEQHEALHLAQAGFSEEGETAQHGETEEGSDGIIGEETVTHVHLAQGGIQLESEEQAEGEDHHFVAEGEEHSFGGEEAHAVHMVQQGAQFGEEESNTQYEHSEEEGHLAEEHIQQYHLAHAMIMGEENDDVNYGGNSHGENDSSEETSESGFEEQAPAQQLVNQGVEFSEDFESYDAYAEEGSHFHSEEEDLQQGETQMHFAHQAFSEEQSQEESESHHGEWVYDYSDGEWSYIPLGEEDDHFQVSQDDNDGEFQPAYQMEPSNFINKVEMQDNRVIESSEQDQNLANDEQISQDSLELSFIETSSEVGAQIEQGSDINYFDLISQEQEYSS